KSNGFTVGRVTVVDKTGEIALFFSVDGEKFGGEPLPRVHEGVVVGFRGKPFPSADNACVFSDEVPGSNWDLSEEAITHRFINVAHADGRDGARLHFAVVELAQPEGIAVDVAFFERTTA